MLVIMDNMHVYVKMPYMEKRKEYATWEETFMEFSHVIKKRSKDPSTQVGATVVSQDNRVLSVGYNGAPNGFPDDDFPWSKNGNELETKYAFVVHAERNAILNFRGNNRELTGATLYVTHYPCRECAKEIIQSGITHVIYDDDHHFDQASHIMFDKCGIIVQPYISN